ncbi:porin [Flagellimonas pelagia]|uniref:Alginate export domain-containing protein n=1 Tax=Flagellimonas pelagia TaxID=2306998 RepID=A0A3A1NFD7_9FLAO|nr:porin [Allomuricauda maritima]RIV41944.1 hypothetical protein D2V05_17685 [Allomuricauda maritima]TXJ90821.1 hypothetical protein FQ017_17525 [Allomuricauda maritima]
MIRFPKIFWGVFSILFVSYVGYAQDKVPMVFHLLGQDDDMSFLLEQREKTIYEDLKWIGLTEHSALSLGGSYRFQTEHFIHENFTTMGNQDNIWYLQRLLLHTHLRIQNHFELYLELNSSTVVGKKDVSPVDKDVLAMNQAFATYHFDDHLSISLGRQNLKFGSRRLIDIREGPNVRRSFDILRWDYVDELTNVTTFFSVPVRTRQGIFDNTYLNFDETFSGLYVTKKFGPISNLDVYGFYQKDNGATYNAGTADERRYSLGVRYFGKMGTFSFNNEGVYQFGRFGELDIRAYTVSLNGELSTAFFGDGTVFGLKTEVISGDRKPGDGNLNTFDPLYPRGAYFGRVARFGPSNLIDFHPYMNIRKSNHYVEMDYDVFWRYSKEDGVYDAGQQLAYPSVNTKAFIGNQFGLLYGLDINNHLNMELETNLIVPDDFLRDSGLSATLFHAVLTAEFRF